MLGPAIAPSPSVRTGALGAPAPPRLWFPAGSHPRDENDT